MVNAKTFSKALIANDSFYRTVYTSASKNDKGKYDSRVISVSEELTEYVVQDHLDGKFSLSVGLIDENNKCLFAVIDIDNYQRSFSKLLYLIYEYSLPLVPVKSKSGGLHLYLFFKERVAATTAIECAKKWASALALEGTYGGVEIFPKQTSLKSGKHQGSSITLPYSGSNPISYVLDAKGEALTIDEFIRSLIVNRKNAKDLIADIDLLPYKDAPPCMRKIMNSQYLTYTTGRNNFLFSFAIYLQKKYGDAFPVRLEEANHTLDNPLTEDEVNAIVSSVSDNTFNYKCKDIPLKDLCESKLCRECEYGVGKDKGHFTGLDYGQLKRVQSAEPYYVWLLKRAGEEDEAFKEVVFKDASSLLDQSVFARLCVDKLSYAPYRMKDNDWRDIVNHKLQTVINDVVSIESDTSDKARAIKEFYKFLTTRLNRHSLPQMIKMGQTYKKDDKYFFIHDAIADTLIKSKIYLKDIGFRAFLQGLGCKEDTLEFENKNGKVTKIHCWSKEMDDFLRNEEGYLQAVKEGDQQLMDLEFLADEDIRKLSEDSMEAEYEESIPEDSESF